MAVVSTGERVWQLRVAGQLYNNTWVEVGVRWTLPELTKPKWAETAQGREKMGGLEMFVGGVGDGGVKMVGQSILYESTDRGASMWDPQPPLLSPDGQPVMMLGCHQNSLMYSKGQGYTGYAGTKDAPAQFDELAIWRRRLKTAELILFLGGYEADASKRNPEQMKVALGNADLSDPGQAAQAQDAAKLMFQGVQTTTPRFPTPTELPTTSTTVPPHLRVNTTTIPTTTTTAPPANEAALRKTMLGSQEMMSMLLKTDGVKEGENPKSVELWLENANLAASLLIGSEENKEKWSAVHKENKHVGAMKTVKEIEEFTLAWVNAVNTSADDRHIPNWKTTYFDSDHDTMRYATFADDFVMNVDKLPMDLYRKQEDSGADKVRVTYPDYSGWEWMDAKSKWDDVGRDNFTVPTGMFHGVPGQSCNKDSLKI